MLLAPPLPDLDDLPEVRARGLPQLREIRGLAVPATADLPAFRAARAEARESGLRFAGLQLPGAAVDVDLREVDVALPGVTGSLHAIRGTWRDAVLELVGVSLTDGERPRLRAPAVTISAARLQFRGPVVVWPVDGPRRTASSPAVPVAELDAWLESR